MYIKLLLAFSLLVSTVNPAYACLPPLDTEPASIAEKSQNASYVFDGVVTGITDTYIKVRVEQYFKGTGLNEVKITQNTAQENSCSDHFVLDQRALFFTDGNMGGLMDLVYDGAFGSIREMNASNFRQVTAVTKCMATYKNGILTVPCIAHQATTKVYKAILKPSNPTDNLLFSLSYAQQVTNAAIAMDNFDQGEAGTTPDNWESGITGFGTSNWKLKQDSTAPSSPLVLKQSGEGDYPWCIKKESRLSDGFVDVKFKAISGSIDQAAGLVWRWKDANNYYVARANALEDNIAIYYMKDGERIAIKYQDLPSDFPVKKNVWQTLRVDFQGNRFIVSFEGKVIIDITDNHITGEGAVGLWTKEDSTTSFDDFSYGKK